MLIQSQPTPYRYATATCTRRAFSVTPRTTACTPISPPTLGRAPPASPAPADASQAPWRGAVIGSQVGAPRVKIIDETFRHMPMTVYTVVGMPTPSYDAAAADASLADRIGRMVRQRRNELGLTQVQLAERANVTQPQVSRLEGGGSITTLPVLARLAYALQADLTLGLIPLADVRSDEAGEGQ